MNFSGDEPDREMTTMPNWLTISAT